MFIKARSLRRMRCEMVSGLAENSAQLVSEFQSRPRVWKIIADRPFYLTTYYKWLLISIFVFVTFKNEKYERKNKYFDDTFGKKNYSIFLIITLLLKGLLINLTSFIHMLNFDFIGCKFHFGHRGLETTKFGFSLATKGLCSWGQDGATPAFFGDKFRGFGGF